MKQDREFLIDDENQDGIKRLKIRQNIDMDSSPQLRKRLMRQLKAGGREFIVDLESVSRIDTSGLATLVEFAFLIRESGGDLTVCGLEEGATDSLTLEQVKDVLNFCRDCEVAM